MKFPDILLKVLLQHFSFNAVQYFRLMEVLAQKNYSEAYLCIKLIVLQECIRYGIYSADRKKKGKQKDDRNETKNLKSSEKKTNRKDLENDDSDL